MANEESRGRGLNVVGQEAGEDAEFLTQEVEISSQQFLSAVLEDQREEVAKMLVHDERLVKSRDVAGATAVLLAVYHGLDDMLGILLRAGVPLDLWEAAAAGQTGRVREILDDEPGLVDGFSEDGFPALCLAAFFGRPEVLDLLVERGADVRRPARNPTGVAPLNSAAAHRDPRLAVTLASRLLAAGAEVEVAQAGGFRPLHQAAAAGNVALVRLLLDHGAEPAPESDLGQTPRDLASQRGHDEVLALLAAS